MMQETEAGKVFPFGIRCAVVAVRVDGEPAAGEKFAPYFDIAGMEKLDEVTHDDIHAVLVEIAVIAEAEKIELQGLAFYHVLIGDVGDINSRKVRLSCLRAEAGEFRTVELDEIVTICVLIGDAFQKRRIVIIGILGILASQLLELIQAFTCIWHGDMLLYKK